MARIERRRPAPLTPAQLARLERQRELPVIQDVRDRRFSRGPACPRCGSTKVIRWGRFSGRQRYRCHGCRRTFSDLTGTPLAYTKRLRLWPAYCACMLDGRSVRASARRVGIHKDTAFRWRHRILAAHLAAPPRPLRGIIELGETAFPYSTKGQHRAEGSHAAGRIPGRPAEHLVRVLLLVDRTGAHWSGVIGERGRLVEFHEGRWYRWRLPLRQICRGHGVESALREAVRGDAVLVAKQGRLSKYAAVARRLGMRYRQAWGSSSLEPLPARRGTVRGRLSESLAVTQDPLHHLAHVRSYTMRLHAWMPRFRGVATKYLENYLVWYEIVDATRRGHFVGELLTWDVRGPPNTMG
ncbi:MAG: hypothetical protein WEB88_08660 [Gemmatimonadota bacterium]